MNALDRIAGYETQKEELRKLIDIFNQREEYLARGASLPKGIVFYGAAGTGKTLFADVLAESCKLKQIKITMDGDPSGRSLCKQIRKAFKKGSRGGTPTMIFFDELDKVLPNAQEEYYTDRSKTILAQLLTLIDGMDSSDNIVFVATCNNYYSLPESITRPGRLDKKIWFGLPDGTSRVEILQMYMEKTIVKFELAPESIAKLTDGFSCAGLRTLINECVLNVDETCYVSKELLHTKIAEISEETIQEDTPDEIYILDAIRNVGSFLVASAFDGGEYVLTLEDGVVCNQRLDAVIRNSHDFYPEDDYDDYDDDYDDYDDEEDDEEATITSADHSYHDYMVAITALMGGFAAEVAITGCPHDNLHHNFCATHSLFTRMCYNGMLGMDMAYHIFAVDDRASSGELIKKAGELYTEITEECLSNAEAIVEKNKELIVALAKILIARKSIEKPDCEAIIAKLGGITLT